MKDEGKKGRTRWNSQQCDRGQTEHEKRDSPFGFLLSLLVYSTYTDNTYTHITVTACLCPAGIISVFLEGGGLLFVFCPQLLGQNVCLSGNVKQIPENNLYSTGRRYYK